MYWCTAQLSAVGSEVVVDTKDLTPDLQPKPDASGAGQERGAESKPGVRIKEVPERDRRRLLMHFLELGESDRLLRFGTVLSDELITRYVQHLDFARDTVFGVYDPRLQLVGVGHLAFTARETMPLVASATVKERVAEFGVSVSESARGMGIGTKMFERAAMHCRNADVDTLYMHCLASNQTMMHIATKARMQIHRDHGEADAYLTLLPANPASMLQEAVQEQVASLDYTLKANTRAALKLLESIPGFKS